MFIVSKVIFNNGNSIMRIPYNLKKLSKSGKIKAIIVSIITGIPSIIYFLSVYYKHINFDYILGSIFVFVGSIFLYSVGLLVKDWVYREGELTGFGDYYNNLTHEFGLVSMLMIFLDYLPMLIWTIGILFVICLITGKIYEGVKYMIGGTTRSVVIAIIVVISGLYFAILCIIKWIKKQ